MPSLREKYSPVSLDESDDGDRSNYQNPKDDQIKLLTKLLLGLGFILGQVVILIVYTAVIWRTVPSQQCGQAPPKDLSKLFHTEVGEESPMILYELH